MQKTNILAIAPYESMKIAIEKLSEDREEIHLDAYIGDLEQGVEILNGITQSKYHAILSRGGTAQMISKITHIPVIEISLSLYDILRAIKMAENFSDKYAIIGFPNITGGAHLLCDLLQYSLEIVTIYSGEEVENALVHLKEEGYQTVVCDMVNCTKARAIGLNAILITSGTESIESAFQQAIKIGRSYLQLKMENALFHHILEGQSQRTVVLNEEGEIFFSAYGANTPDLIVACCKERCGELGAEQIKFTKTIENTLYMITAKAIPLEDTVFYAFCLTEFAVPIATNRYGIEFCSKKEAEELFFNSFYGINGAMGELHDSILHISQSKMPVIVMGESGTGKEQISRFIYCKGRHQSHPLITIDCGLMNEKSWAYITNHYESPLNDSDNTIYFKNIDALSEEKGTALLSAIVAFDGAKRNKLIFTCISNEATSISEIGQRFIKRLSCLSLHLPPLRYRPDEIPAFAGLYLSHLNMLLGKQIIGFEPNATQLLMKYNWPDNYTQFKRVLSELATLTTGPYISNENTLRALEKEAALMARAKPKENLSTVFPLSGSWEEIQRAVMKEVLAQNNGNQSAAARQLGISRTTLWRLLTK